VTTLTIFLGWDAAAVMEAAKAHPAREAKELQIEKEERQKERAAKYQQYLDTMKPKKGAKCAPVKSPVGSYIVDCEAIEKEWRKQAENMTLSIYEEDEAGIFQASFDFGILEGIMIISTEKDALEEYCSQHNCETESDDDGVEGDDQDEDDENEGDGVKQLVLRPKRKAQGSSHRGPPSKTAKIEVTQLPTYLLRLKCREAGEGVIYYHVEKGTITFKDKNLSSFLGKVRFPFVGANTAFTARKISDVPGQERKLWADYSKDSYDYGLVEEWL
jgi:hypothetical protein